MNTLIIFGASIWHCWAMPDNQLACARAVIEATDYRDCVAKKREVRERVEAAGDTFRGGFCGRQTIVIEPLVSAERREEQ